MTGKLRAVGLFVALSAALLVTPSSAATGPQLRDPAGDANGVNGQGIAPVSRDNAIAPANQAYADVLSVQWGALRSGGKVTGLSITATLAAPPKPPAGVSLTYRIWGTAPGCNNVGIVYYDADPNRPGIVAQSTVRYDCGGVAVVATGKLPVVAGNVLTWSVPFKDLPKALKAGTVLTNLRFETRLAQNMPADECLPVTPPSPPWAGGTCVWALGLLDDGAASASYRMGS